MKKLNLIIIASLCMVLTACGTSNSIEAKKQTYIPNKISIDANTLKKSEVKEFLFNEFNKNFDNTVTDWDNNLLIGEINILEEDNSTDYNVIGEDILYNDVNFHGLNTIADRITYPCNKNTFINFIIKTYDTESTKDIYTYLLDYQSDAGEESESADVTLDEDISDNKRYIELKNKYGTKANWQVDVFEYGGKNKVSICGCSEYMFVLNSISDIKINTNDVIESETETETETETEQADTPIQDIETDKDDESIDTSNQEEAEDNADITETNEVYAVEDNEE